MRRRWLKRVVWILLTPILLFVMLMVLLYVPPVQNFLRKQVAAYTSEATGMEISIHRIDLRFPLNLLVRGVQVVQPPDTLFNLGSLNVHVQAWPLFQGRVEIDDISLNDVAVNSAGLVDGMRVQGVLGHFALQSHGVDLFREDAVINRVELSDTHVQVMLSDTTTTPSDTAKTALNWTFALHRLKLNRVSVEVQMPLDSMRMAVQIGEAQMEEAAADLKHQFYGWKKFRLNGTSVHYDTGNAAPADGFDASHIALRDVRLGLDSVMYYGRNLNAILRECSMNERSGLNITSLTGRFFADSTVIRVPNLRLLTPHSDMDFTAQTYWELIDIPTTGRLTSRFNAHIGKQDVLLFTGALPSAFKDAYPFRPLVIHAETEGNFKQLQFSRFTVDLPGAFALSGGGELRNLTDSVQRNGTLHFEMKTQNLNFLTGLGGLTPDGSVVIPDNMNVVAHVEVNGPQYKTGLQLREEEGLLDLKADYNTTTEAYSADLEVNALQLHHFLPKDSIYILSTTLSAKGHGVDLASHRSVSSLQATLSELQYGRWNISGITLQARLKSALATLQLESDNVLLRMHSEAEMHLDRRYLDGTWSMEVEQLDLHKLGLSATPLKHPFAFHLGAEARLDSIKLNLNAGDLHLQLRARNTLKKFLHQSDRFLKVLAKQVEEKYLNHADLRKELPSASMRITTGQKNPISYYLATKGISYHDFTLHFGFTPSWGINGRTAIHGLRMDSLQLDTLFVTIRQDTTRMTLQGGIINGPRNPQFVFRGMLTGELRNNDADLKVDYVDGRGETGLDLGLNARLLGEGHGKGNGMALHLTPAEPIIAYRKFHFVDNNNWIYLHKNARVYANVDMLDAEGMGFRMHSLREDTVSLQNIDIELRRIRLDEISRILPYFPALSGLFSAEAHYIQTPTSLQVSTEATIEKLTYERQPVGNIGLAATWLPGEAGTHYLNTYLTYNGKEVMTADGTLHHRREKDSIEVTTRLEHFPLTMANAFVPDQMVSFTGDVDGEMYLSGELEKPKLRGDISLDSVSIYARQVGARYWFDNRPVQIRDNRLVFDKFAIYTTSKNPFTIDGNVNFRNLARPTANLKLLAQNYTLLDAPRTRESLIYGKAFVGLRATIRGPLDALTMRGSMNLLGNTDITYVLTDSPLTVENRLEGLVSFTSFRDTASVLADAPVMSLGGMDMIMSVHIDNAVRLRADLSTDRSKFVELEGGGDLNLQYTPQGNMNLSGRYTLSGGIMKYSLPIIPLKEFQFNNGSYVDWTGNPMNPSLRLKASERIRASVADGEGGGSRMVNFDVSISIKNRLESPELVFDITAPDDATIENELLSMGAEERSKQAVAMLATGIYLNNSGKTNLNMGTALNSVLQSQINALAGAALKSASFSVGVEDHQSAETGDKRTDYSFRYSQRFFNDRVQIIIGGKVSTGSNATNDAESFIDNISLEYRLDGSGTRYVRVFHDKNYESVLDGEITETGVGLILRRKMDRLGELFIFRNPEKKNRKK